MKRTGKSSIAIAGGGISGLTIAWLLQKAGNDVTLFESRTMAGGAIGTEANGGWMAERGPNSMLLTSPRINELIDGLELRQSLLQARPEARKRFIVRGGRPVQMPTSPPAFITSALFGIGAKLNLLREPFIGPGNPDTEESLADFVRRRLGREFLDYAINPFVAGVYAGSPERLSVRHAFPKLYDLEQKYGSLIRGQIRGARERKKSGEVAKDKAAMLSFRGGLSELIRALETRLEGKVLYGRRVQRATRENDGRWLLSTESRAAAAPYVFTAESTENAGGAEEGYNSLSNGDRGGVAGPGGQAGSVDRGALEGASVTYGPFDNVIYAGMAHDLAGWRFADGVAGGLEALAGIQYPPVTSVTLGFRKSGIDHPLDGFGMLVPEVEPFRILGTLFTSSIFECRAPSDEFATLTTYIGGTRNPEYAALPDDDLLRMVTGDLDELIGLHGEPLFISITRWPKAIPQYTVGYGVFKDAMDRFEADNPGFRILGNFRNGISVSDCIKAAFEMAGELAAGR
jgi:protoporphyrinogen/coproporphyrinogen III oxidase